MAGPDRRCCAAASTGKVTVELPGGETRVVDGRPAAIAAITRAGGGKIRG